VTVGRTPTGPAAGPGDIYQASPTVKLTGGQRIDLLGVRKEDLPQVWADLDMPSGYAYGNSFRTVKTCVGSDFCRFGLGDSTALGMAIETRFQGPVSAWRRPAPWWSTTARGSRSG
jgi:NAD(P)H-nitrite reductase large subunit